jgi:hypothetical protein
MPHNLSIKWTIHKVFQLSPLDPLIYGNREVNLTKVLDPTDSIEADAECHIDKVMSCIKKYGKVSFLVKWRVFPAKKL